MSLSVRLSPEEESLLDTACRLTARSKSQLVRQAIQDYCQRLQRAEQTPFALGSDLFGQGQLATGELDEFKSALGEKLRAKHRRLD